MLSTVTLVITRFRNHTEPQAATPVIASTVGKQEQIWESLPLHFERATLRRDRHLKRSKSNQRSHRSTVAPGNRALPGELRVRLRPASL